MSIIRDEMVFFDFFVGISFIRRQTSAVFERPTLRGCQCLCVLGRIKPLRTLTLPCQETNPVGVICGGAVAEISWWGLCLGASRCGIRLKVRLFVDEVCEKWVGGGCV